MQKAADSQQVSCAELVEVITDYLEGSIPPAQRARFEAHLADCSGCQIYLDQMRQVIHTLGKLSEDTLTPAAREAFLQAFRDWKKS